MEMHIKYIGEKSNPLALLTGKIYKYIIFQKLPRKKLIEIVRDKPQFNESEGKWIYFDSELQLVVVQNKSTEDIISVVRRKKPKKIWQNV